MLSNKDLNELLQIFIIIEQYNSTGINVMNALELYEKKCKSKKVVKILNGVKRDVSRGMKLYDAFSKHPNFFPSYISEMIRLNEGTGQAEDIYADIVKSLEQEVDLRNSVGGMLKRMIFLFSILLITISIVLFVVLPSMGKMMTSLSMDLPFYIHALIWIGDSLIIYWWLLLAGIILSTAITAISIKRHPAKFALILLHMPLYGEVVYYQIQYRFAMIFGLCKEAGLDTIKSLNYTKQSINYLPMSEMLEKVIKNLGRFGDNLTVAIEKADEYHLLDDSYYMIIAAGEKSDMAALMKKRSDFYRKRLLVTSENVSNKLNNIVLTPTFILLGIIVILVLAPMFNMMYQMSSGGNLGI